MQLDSFTGGIFDTNSFYLLNSGILIDAPQGAADWLQEKGYRISTLLLTHGHIDHVWDAARIQKEQGCRVGYHADTEQMVTERDFFKSFGYMWEIEPIAPGFHIDEADSVVIEGQEFQVLLVPGHCPGSLCFLDKKEAVLFGGDVLFAGGVGRWDLPGGDGPLLFKGIKEKVFALDDDITVLPGHGPATKIGIERETNPYVGEGSSFT
ncbi:MAG: MBL fold metallo-hydrolase [Chthoniobacter sp.]|uniref:MBL fold metallo-hydrolase n=1 Tax=Chthoniobacter sp. TaxID=2510640 RepID=UPI0032A9CE73